jgi:hypothetical protein
MGTSHATPAPNTKRWGDQVVGTLKSPVRNAGSVLDATIAAALPLVPAGFIAAPIAVAAYESLRFANLVQRDGMDAALRATSVRLVSKYVAPSISSDLWNQVVDKVNPQFGASIYGKVAETAFKQTLNTVLTKGVEAMEE